MALDVGDRRIGVALSDPTGLLATPFGAVDRKHADPSDICEIGRIARENEVDAIIVGLPRLLSGRLGGQAKLVKSFVSELAARVDLPVTTVDERYTTIQAERMLRESGRQPSRHRGLVDASAAAVMLQAHLDAPR